jgi:hypothetical protein
MALETFPFETKLTFKYLIKFWELQTQKNKPSIIREQAKLMLDAMVTKPELLSQNVAIEAIKKNSDCVEALCSIIYSSAHYEDSIFGVMPAFSHDYFYASPRFVDVFSFMQTVGYSEVEKRDEMRFMVQKAYWNILKKYYNKDLDFDRSFIMKIPSTNERASVYLKVISREQFYDVQFRDDDINNLPFLSEEELQNIENHFVDIEWLIKKIPPEQFFFEGFFAFHSIDVTKQETLSQIKRLLIDSNSIIHRESFTTLQNMFRILLDIKDLQLIIAAQHDDELFVISLDSTMEHGCIFFDSKHLKIKKSGLYAQAKKNLTFEYQNNGNCNGSEALFSQCSRSNMAIPLVHNKELVGMLGFASEEANPFNTMLYEKMSELTPLLALLVSRYLDDFENRSQLIIQKNFTSIHPSVHWRFKEAALNFVQNQEENSSVEMEKIIFKDVYPLYAVSDIRGSTDHRNDAITDDLLENLSMAQEIIEKAFSHNAWPILQEYLYKINLYASSIKDGLQSGEEFRVVQFLKKDIEPAFNDLSHFDENIAGLIQNYKAVIEKESGLLYKKRAAFDDSVMLLNSAISEVIESAQHQAQEMYPHYFDKQVTDGVDQNLYIGKSMSDLEHFDSLFVKNLRLWQFETLCNVAQKADAIKDTLPLCLHTTHLIVTQNNPITISFNQDEKRFRVDGAYNIRYEIMKKRIDKAIIKESKERLTQPNQIAIVYTQVEEALEYHGYIEYLQDKGLIGKEVEEFELESLQGISGLKALRVTILSQ